MIRCAHDKAMHCAKTGNYCFSFCADYEPYQMNETEAMQLADIIKATHTPDTAEETK